MQTAQVLANFSLGEADLLRRAMGKKIAAEMDQQKVRFLEGTKENEIDDDTAGEIFDLLAKFAGYGFNKSHSAAYGMIVYQTAFLKAHYRAEFMAAVMSVESSNTDKLIAYIGDCRRADLQVLPPDINESALSFDVPTDRRDVIRFGLAAVKNVGEAAVEHMIEVRAKAPGGRFSSFMDFLERIDHSRVNRRVLESLIKGGAFDWTETSRRSLVEGLEGAMRVGLRTQIQRAAGQVSLFGGGACKAPDYRFPDVPEWPTTRKLAEEKRAVGFFLTGHPLEAYAEELDRYTSAPIGRIDGCTVDAEVVVAGVVSAIRTRRDKRGQKMAFVTLEDATGGVECTFFSRAYQKSAEVLASDQPLLVRGKLQLRGEELKILADSAEPLATVRGSRTRRVRICLDWVELQTAGVEAFCSAFEASAGGCMAEIELTREDGAKVRLRFPPDRGLAAEVALVERMEALFRRTGVVRFA
jgi:DNA polymerase-3 subunit alpha